MPARRPLAERFAEKIDTPGGPDACWPWTAKARCANGSYGLIGTGVGKINESSHRVAWILANGPIVGGLFVLHKCDFRLCCNPTHLFLGTQADNMVDMTLKGRRFVKLYVEDVIIIERLYVRGGWTQQQLGDLFGVTQETVSSVVRREAA